MPEKPLTLLHIYGGTVKIGGHYRSGLAMAKYLVKSGHRVIALAPGAVPEMIQAFQAAGAELRLLPVLGTISKLPSLSGWKEVAQIVETANVDVVHSMDSVNIPRGYLAAVKTGKQFVCTEAGWNSTSHFPPRKGKVVIFSREQLHIYRDFYRLREEHIRIIEARIDADLYFPDDVPQDFIDKYRLHKDGLVVGMACRLERLKAHQIDLLIDFVRSYQRDGVPLRIFIAGDGELRLSFQDQAEQVNTPRASIHFIGSIYSIDEIRRFYNFCDVVIGSGRGIMEAMACGKPVIIQGANGQAEMIGQDTIENAAYYNFSGRHLEAKKCAGSIIDVLEVAVNNPALVTDCAEFCSGYIKKQLDAQVGARKLIDWYGLKQVRSTMQDFVKWYIEAIYWKLRASLKYRFRRFLSQSKRDSSAK